MNAYQGKDPYVFVSYAHKDWSEVEPIIMQLKHQMCRVWYDEGLRPGGSWDDDLAEHIMSCACFVVLLTREAVESQYVKAELTFAISKKRRVLPVLFDGVILPPGLEFTLASIQCASLAGCTEPKEKVKKIIPYLPGEVFAPLLKPFLSAEGYSFFLEEENVVFESPTYTGPERVSENMRITARDQEGNEYELFRFEPGFAYDSSYNITQCQEIADDYFVGKIQGSYVLHVLARFELDYPLTGPDFDALLLFGLRVPKDEVPTVKLFDYQIVRLIHSAYDEGKKLKDTAWSSSVIKKLDQLLTTG